MAEHIEDIVESGSDDQLAASTSNRASKTAPYFTILDNGDSRCNECMNARLSKKVIIKKDKTGSTCGKWRHLKKYHPKIHRSLRPPLGQPSVADIYGKSEAKETPYIGINAETIKEAVYKLICRLDMPFSNADHPGLSEFACFFAQRDVTLPSAKTTKETFCTKFEEGKEALRKKLEHVKMVSLTIDTWTSENQVAILGITVHWIDEAWTLCERVLATEELQEEHSGDNMAARVHSVLCEFNLTEKVQNFVYPIVLLCIYLL